MAVVVDFVAKSYAQVHTHTGMLFSTTDKFFVVVSCKNTAIPRQNRQREEKESAYMRMRYGQSQKKKEVLSTAKSIEQNFLRTFILRNSRKIEEVKNFLLFAWNKIFVKSK